MFVLDLFSWFGCIILLYVFRFWLLIDLVELVMVWIWIHLNFELLALVHLGCSCGLFFFQSSPVLDSFVRLSLCGELALVKWSVLAKYD